MNRGTEFAYGVGMAAVEQRDDERIATEYAHDAVGHLVGAHDETEGQAVVEGIVGLRRGGAWVIGHDNWRLSSADVAYAFTFAPRERVGREAFAEFAIDGLMPGMVCKVSAGTAGSGIVIPASSVKTGMDGRYVWIVRDGKAARRSIETGGFSGDGVIVESGLASGDLLIVEGAKKVSSGMTVKVVE